LIAAADDRIVLTNDEHGEQHDDDYDHEQRARVVIVGK
jgi:hypothetical protein